MTLDKSKNIVSQPPLNVSVIDNNGLLSKAWAIWFRDIYNRVAYKGGNAIDDLDGELDGTIETLEEVIAQVLINIQDISENSDSISTNAEGIAANIQDILNLEHRAFGDVRPDNYDEAAGYLTGDYVVYPSDDPQNYFIATEDIIAPAGPFDSGKWLESSIIANLALILITRIQAIQSFVAAGYGGIGVNAVEVIGTIDSTFQTLEGFDIDLIASPLDVTYDKANHGIKLDRAGIWEFAIKVALTFDEVNAGRQIQLRSYNATTATPSTITFNYFVGRNQAGENLILTFAVEVAEGDEGELIQLQVGSAADTFTNSSNIGTIYQVKHISERKEELGA